MHDRSATSQGDAFGAALEHCWNDGKGLRPTPEELEFDTGDVVCGDMLHYFDESESLPEHEQLALRECSGRVLDVGVGAGRHALAVADLSEVECVEGVDVSPGAVAVACRRGVGAQVVDWRELPAAPRYDTVLMLGNNLGLLRQAGGAEDGFVAARHLLRRHGRLLGSSGHIAGLPATVREAGAERFGSEGAFVCRIRFNMLTTDWLAYEFYAPPDLIEAAERASFRSLRVHQGAAGWAVVLEAV